MDSNLKITPLNAAHIEAGAKMVDFGGWHMPVQYKGIIEEHQVVREKAGLFDVSHMGEIEITGPDAMGLVQRLIANDLGNIVKNQILYTPMCFETGGIVDDLLVYRMDEQKFLLVVNASNKDRDLDWILSNRYGDVEINDVSEQMALMALQGPLAQSILQKLTDYDLNNMKFFFFDKLTLAGVNCLVSRTGYTGEDGFEIYVEPTEARKIWDQILVQGQSEGVMPIGLGARDTLRLEAKLPLYGNELSPEINPLEAGLGMFVKLGKDDFIGKKALTDAKEKGVTRKLVGFEMLERGIARSQYSVYSGDTEVGFVTSGTFSPTLKKNIGLALIESEYNQLGEEIKIAVRNKKISAKIIKTPFYKREAK
ncbi:aminomethyltransferase [Desulfitispora alkaliphila]|uniref:glycine cleavage system aminomethyltransferase GcvT n=1 Tax=Desulfitispora alkaliphila TaxID=622674 RepID=UPI003D23CD11